MQQSSRREAYYSPQYTAPKTKLQIDSQSRLRPLMRCNRLIAIGPSCRTPNRRTSCRGLGG